MKSNSTAIAGLTSDKAALVTCWLALGGEESNLYRGNATNDPSKWLGVTVEGGRVTKVDWSHRSLTGTISEVRKVDRDKEYSFRLVLS